LPKGTRYVDAAAPAGGDGTLSAPFQTLLAALAAVPSGGTIALAKGKYVGASMVTKKLQIRGRCAALVEIDGDNGFGWVASGSGAELHISGVTIHHTDFGIGAYEGGKAFVRGVHIRDVSSVALASQYASSKLVVEDSLVSDMGAKSGPGGRGLNVLSQSEMVATRVMLQRVCTIGVLAAGVDAKVVLDEVRILDTRETSAGKYGRGIEANGGGRVTASRVEVKAARQFGVRVSGAGSMVDARWMRVHGVTGEVASGDFGMGVMVASGAKFKARGVSIEQVQKAGLWCSEGGTSTDLAGVRIAQVKSTFGGGIEGFGASWGNGAKGSAVALHVQKCQSAGVMVTGKSSKLTASGLLVNDIVPDTESELGGYGVMLDNGAQASLEHLRIDKATQTGLVVTNAGTSVEARHVVITSTKTGTTVPGTDEEYLLSAAVVSHGGAYLLLDDARLHHNDGYGLLASMQDTLVEASDLVVDACQAGPAKKLVENSVAGDGVSVFAGAHVVIDRARISRCRRHAMVIGNPETVVTARDLLIDTVLPDAILQEMGLGIAVLDSSTLLAQGVRVMGARTTGLFVDGIGTRAHVLGLRVEGTLAMASNSRFGDGVQVSRGATLLAAGGHSAHNRSAGLISANSGTKVEFVGGLMLDNTPDEGLKLHGFGAVAVYGGELRVLSSRLMGNHVAGLAVMDGGLAWLIDSVAVKTKAALFGREAGITTLGDGVLSFGPSQLTLERSASLSHPRTGLLIDGPVAAQVRGCLMTGSLYGAAVQGGANVDLENNAIYGNELQDLRIDGGLQVPKPPDLLSAD
jgi:hypothetical protein